MGAPVTVTGFVMIGGAEGAAGRGIYRSSPTPADAVGALTAAGRSRKMLKKARKLTGQAKRNPAALHRR